MSRAELTNKETKKMETVAEGEKERPIKGMVFEILARPSSIILKKSALCFNNKSRVLQKPPFLSAFSQKRFVKFILLNFVEGKNMYTTTKYPKV